MNTSIPAMQHVFTKTDCPITVEPFTPCVYVNESDIDFVAPDEAYVVAIVFNDSDKPLWKRGMIFPVNGLESYVYKRTWWNRLFGRKGKVAIPPQSARAVILTKPLWRYKKLYYAVID